MIEINQVLADNCKNISALWQCSTRREGLTGALPPEPSEFGPLNVVILHKVLRAVGQMPLHPYAAVSEMRLPDDADEWLDLRHRAFADEVPPVRPWRTTDVLRELGEPRSGIRRITWLARRHDLHSTVACGAVSVSLPAKMDSIAGLHWLMVDPRSRREGIGSLLLHTAEEYCLGQGYKGLRLETHSEWVAAIRFYERHGFQ